MDETDVVVVGGGGAGLAAAAAAASLGRRVVLVEKSHQLGGSTAWSVGSISATNTPQQRHAGIVDHPDAHFEDLETLAGPMANRDNRELRRLLVDNVTATMAWLEDVGLVFVGPNVEPPHRLPRMHNVVPNSRAFPAVLGRHCRRAGVDIRLGHLADRLLLESGRVVGVSLKRGGRPAGAIRAKGAVVLAGGDFSASRELKERLAGPATASLEPVNPEATGDALRIALEVGAEVVNGDIVRGPIIRFVPPKRESLLRRLPPRRTLGLAMRWSLGHLPDTIRRSFAMSFLTTALGPSKALFEAGAILVNAEGRRFVDELGRPSEAVAAQPGGLAYIVLDGRLSRHFRAWPNFVSTAPGVAYAYLGDYRRNRRDIFHEAPDVGGLARSLEVPVAELERSIAETRAGAGAERSLGEPPFIALGPVRSYVVFTDGGLRVTQQLEVMGRDGLPIGGLYAAGSTGQGGVLLEGHGHHLGWAFVSGRIAGRNAALQVGAALGP
ncbi:MAG: FAD-dependent oxidoreductase [Hyphomicrobiaceae bacterium]|nr:FAD-dependent oxidoreductase [Hyphomicrobiaceae bacterium]